MTHFAQAFYHTDPIEPWRSRKWARRGLCGEDAIETRLTNDPALVTCRSCLSHMPAVAPAKGGGAMSKPIKLFGRPIVWVEDLGLGPPPIMGHSPLCNCDECRLKESVLVGGAESPVVVKPSLEPL